MIILYILAALFVAFCLVLTFSLCRMSGHHSRLEEQQEARRSHECGDGNCNQGRDCPARNQRPAQAGAGPRSHYRWPHGIGAHAIALCALAVAFALAHWLTH